MFPTSLIVATDITVYYRPEDEVSIIELLDKVFKVYPSIKVSMKISSMVPEGECIVIRNDFRTMYESEPLKF
jgi:hypothetical protein